jgi:hypothetical protein
MRAIVHALRGWPTPLCRRTITTPTGRSGTGFCTAPPSSEGSLKCRRSAINCRWNSKQT